MYFVSSYTNYPSLTNEPLILAVIPTKIYINERMKSVREGERERKTK